MLFPPFSCLTSCKLPKRMFIIVYLLHVPAGLTFAVGLRRITPYFFVIIVVVKWLNYCIWLTSVHPYPQRCFRFRKYSTSLTVVRKPDKFSKFLWNISTCLFNLKEKLWSTERVLTFPIAVQSSLIDVTTYPAK